MILNNIKDTLEKRKKLRNNSTKEEVVLWNQIKNSKLNRYKFRRQHSISHYILDFYCPKIKLGIEIDGNQHNEKDAKEYDEVRTNFLNSLGIKILRFTNFEINKNLNFVIKTIQNNLN